jgi:hypothetical protein
MRAPWLLAVGLAACTHTYDGDYDAEVTTTLGDGAPAITRERVEFRTGDVERNELFLLRGWPDDPPCELALVKHGGFGMAFDADQACTHAGATWALQAGRAPNASGPELVIELRWSAGDVPAIETLRILL